MTGQPTDRSIAPASTRRRAGVVVASGALLVAGLTGCTSDADASDSQADGSGSGRSDDTASSASGATAPSDVPPVRLRSDALREGPLTVDTVVDLTAANGTLQKVRVQGTSAEGSTRLPGALDQDGSWSASQLLEPGTTYRLSAVAVDGDGKRQTLERSFRTQELTLDEQTYPSLAPLGGETVGVGMPVIVNFDVPVTDRAEVERHLSVQSSPEQPGSWHWISAQEVRWRPKTYWQPGTDVTVHADINGVDAGNGIYGQMNRTSRFRVGDAVVMKVDVAAHQMRVFQDDRLLRTIPISAGKPGFTTRSGIKVIIEKFRTKRMDAATTGISQDDPEYYNISNVEYAQRVTYTGEFLHAAPWSVSSQGVANASHGCVGMSTENAAWLYALTKRGDVVDVTGSDRPMEATNGYGDWNVPWSAYRAGSALS